MSLKAIRPVFRDFSKRQLEVIDRWGKSFDPVLVAREMEIKVSTVHTHLKRMRKKIGVRKTVEVWEYVMQHKVPGSGKA